MIGENIKKLRQHNNMTQMFVAKKMMISTSTLSSWENNLRMPSFASIQKLAKLFRVSALELIGKYGPNHILAFSSEQEKLLVFIKMLNDRQCERTKDYLINLLDLDY